MVHCTLSASEAWLRAGLHERKHGQFDDAIKRFSSIVSCSHAVGSL